VGNPATTPAARAKIAAARRGKPTTGGPLSPQQRANISAALKGRVLPEEHRRKTSETMKRIGHRPPVMRGSDNPKWRGGRTLIRQMDYTNPLYIGFRDGVLARDNYTCQECGVRDRLHAHHVKPWASHPDLRYDIENGLTLCHSCHAAIHRGVPPPKAVGPRTLADLESGQTADA
jgi:hypothetical protein